MRDTHALRDALLGGPGLDGYAYQAAIYCVDCGRSIIRKVFKDYPEVDDARFRDSEEVPQPIFFGESDSPEHCDACGEYLYGKNQAE